MGPKVCLTTDLLSGICTKSSDTTQAKFPVSSMTVLVDMCLGLDLENRMPIASASL